MSFLSKMLAKVRRCLHHVKIGSSIDDHYQIVFKCEFKNVALRTVATVNERLLLMTGINTVSTCISINPDLKVLLIRPFALYMFIHVRYMQ